MDGGCSHSPPTFEADSQTTSDEIVEFYGGGAASFGRHRSNLTTRRGSYRAVANGAASAGFYCDFISGEDPHHFLDSCFLCKIHLAGNRDIFMYRGDTPFCSEECRQQQIEMDEAQEKKWKRVNSAKKQEQQHISSAATTPSESKNIHVRAAGTVVAG